MARYSARAGTLVLTLLLDGRPPEVHASVTESRWVSSQSADSPAKVGASADAAPVTVALVAS
jgi:hypothetical protein